MKNRIFKISPDGAAAMRASERGAPRYVDDTGEEVFGNMFKENRSKMSQFLPNGTILTTGPSEEKHAKNYHHSDSEHRAIGNQSVADDFRNN